MLDDDAKAALLRRLQRDREALVWKLDGVSDYDVRRPLTSTGTNLLGLVKHVATVEARYLGEVFGRPSPEPLPAWQDYDGSDHWAAPGETREQILGFYRRAWAHSDATVNQLDLDSPGHVPWWSEPAPNTTLYAVLLHVLSETVRHAGHADILREGLDGRTGLRADHQVPIDAAARVDHCAKLERMAKAAAQRL